MCMVLKHSRPSHKQVWTPLWLKGVLACGKRLFPVHVSSVGSQGDQHSGRVFPWYVFHTGSFLISYGFIYFWNKSAIFDTIACSRTRVQGPLERDFKSIFRTFLCICM